MRPISERIGNWLPAVAAAALPTVFLPNVVDAYILPRASIVITAACLGTGLALLVPNRPGLGALRWPLAAAAAAAVLAFAFSVSWPLSLIGSYTRYESLPVRLAYLGLLAVPVWLLRSERARASVPVAFVIGVAIACLQADIQAWGLRLGQFLVIDPAAFRPDGNLGNANLLGALIAMALPLCMTQMHRINWTGAAAWLSAALMVSGLIVSTSRSGALGAVAGCAALIVFRLQGRGALVGAAVAAILVLGGLLAVVYSPLNQLNGDPAAARAKLYPDAVHMVFSRPLTGWGEDATGLVFGRFLGGDYATGVTFDRVHSGPLDLGATQGLLGLAATGWVLVLVFRGLWRWRWEGLNLSAGRNFAASFPAGAVGAALTGYGVWVLFNFDWSPATGAFWLLAGTGWSAVRSAETAGGPAASIRPVWSLRATALRVGAGVALTATAVAFGALPLLADAWYTNGRGDLAVRVDPLQAQYHRALGETLVQQGRESEGLQQLRLAASLGESDPALYVELGDEELQAGNVDQARADYRAALLIDPYWAPARQRLYGKGA